MLLDESRHCGWRKTRKALTINYWILAPWILTPARGDYVDAPPDCMKEVRVDIQRAIQYLESNQVHALLPHVGHSTRQRPDA